MATEFRFGNKIIKLPGAYSRIVSGRNNPPQDLDYGRILIIDNPNLNSSLASDTAAITIFADNTASGTTVTSAAHGLIENQNVTISATTNYDGEYTIFNVTTNTFDIAIAFVADDGTGTWVSVFNGMLGGSGVNGEQKTGIDSIYSFNRIQEFQDFVGHGWWYKAAEFLFKPDGTNAGVSNIDVIKASTTTSATMTFTTAGSGVNFIINTLDEGLQANAVINATKLVSGYSFIIESGVIDTAKWIFKIYRGTYRGTYSDGQPYNEISQTVAEKTPQLLAQSPEFDDISTLVSWANTDEIFNSLFILDPTSDTSGAVIAGDVVAYASFAVATSATGGTEVYGTTDLTDALEAVADLDYNFVITSYADQDSPQSDANVIKIQAHLLDQDTEFDKYLILYGSDTSLTTNMTNASALDSERNLLTHGGIIKSASRTVAPTGLRTWSSFFHMCYQLGRMLGLEPQVPLTYKTLDIQGLQDNLSKQKRRQALDAGVLCTIYDTKVNDFVVLQDINTLQANDNILNPDGTSHVIQFNRIKSQLNKELVINARKDLLGNPLGVNRNTLSAQDVKDFVKTYLTRKIANPNDDNLILDFGNITVTRDQDAYDVTYEFVPNDEIRILLFTGFAL